MGFASLMEDIVDRLTDDFNSLKHSISGGSGTRKRTAEYNHQHALALLKVCEETIRELNRNLDLVTDPVLDLPRRVKDLEKAAKEHDRIVDQLQKIGEA